MITLLVMLLVTIAAVSGCSQTTRHDVLTFFFTGVPEPGEEAARETRAAATPVAKKKKKRKFLSQTPFFVHGPYGAGQCERCHATTASKPFRTGKAQVSDTAVSRAVNIGPRMAFPQEELCVSCHSEKSPGAARANGLQQHRPVAKGWCTACHSPHKSKRQYTLLKANNVELCTQCHAINDLQLTAQHKQDPAADCIACHNPHVGKSPLLLKAEYDEWQSLNGS